MTEKKGSGHHHQQKGGQLQGQQKRGQMAQDDRRQESGRTGGTMPQQDSRQGRQSHEMERQKAEKGKGGPA